MGKEIEYKMVDLGLPSGLKWADRNVGAVNVQDYGDYFMWGSTTPDTNNVCDWAHAPFNNGSRTFDEEYFNANWSEWLTDKGVLKPEYDAAHVIMGDQWRTPTQGEMQELTDGTTQSEEKLNGVAGIRFTAPNGNSIFMPFAGSRDGSEVENVGDFGSAWSSCLSVGNDLSSRRIRFDYYGGAYVSSSVRYFGFVVRGVCQ